MFGMAGQVENDGFTVRGADLTGQLLFPFRRYYLLEDANGHNGWREEVVRRTIPANQVAIVICDMWDAHCSRGASERVEAMAPRMNEVVKAARAKGIHIIHAPSETMDAYADTLARRRMRAAPYIAPPTEGERQAPPLPIDYSDGGSDTGEPTWHKAWSCQHPILRSTRPSMVFRTMDKRFTTISSHRVYAKS